MVRLFRVAIDVGSSTTDRPVEVGVDAASVALGELALWGVNLG